MADEKNKKPGSGLKEMFTGFGKSIAKDAENKAKAWAWGAISDGLDMIGNNAKKSISTFIFKGEAVPKVENGRMFKSDGTTSSNYRNYDGYSSSTQQKTTRVGDRPSNMIPLIKGTEEEIDTIIAQVYRKIDAADRCSVANLYTFPKEKITPVVTDWNWGWTERNKGGFSKAIITEGQYAGLWRLVTPTPHLLDT